MDITTTSVMPPAVELTLSKRLLSIPVPSMIHKIPAMQKSMPAGGGSIFRQKQYDRLPTATVPLGNSGINPPANTPTAIHIDATMDFYGKLCAVVKPVLIARNPKHVLTHAWQLEGRFNLTKSPATTERMGKRGRDHGMRFKQQSELI